MLILDLFTQILQVLWAFLTQPTFLYLYLGAAIGTAIIFVKEFLL